MKRGEATRLIEAVLAVVCGPHDDPVLGMVTGIDVFGSYARGASDPGDVDLNVEYDRQAALAMFDVYEWMRGKTTSAIKVALAGRTRKIQMTFEMRLNPQGYRGIPLTPLWQRGDDLDTALARLHAISEDATAGRAPRQHMLPELDGLDTWLPLWIRGHLSRAVTAGAVRLERVDLPDARVTDRSIARYLDERWKPGRPLNRAGHAMASHFQGRGIDVGTVHLHGQDVRDPDTPYFAGFAGRYLRHVPYHFTEYAGREHVELPRPPTMTQPLEALRIIATDPDWFKRSDILLWDQS